MHESDLTNPKPLRVAIYVRISADHAGLGLGVERQETAARELAARHGWEVVRVFSDPSVSAYSGKPRPAYKAMTAAIKRGSIDLVIAWALDRLYRRIRELEDWIELVEKTGVRTETVMAGSFDVNTSMGRAMARMAITFATLEVDNSRDRILAQKLQAAKAGRFGGGQRPYGYTDGCEEVNEDEAVVLKRMVAEVINGRSFNQVAQGLDRDGIRTQHGNRFNALNVRNILTHKRYLGIRTHHEKEYPAEWPALLDRDTWDALQLAIKERQQYHKQKGPMRKFLLTGFAFCGKCGKRMNTSPKKQRDGSYVTRYVCRGRNEHGDQDGCGGIMRLVAPVDLLVSESIIYRLETGEFDAAVNQNEQANAELKQALVQQRIQASRLQDIRNDYATGQLAKTEYQNLLSTAQARLEELTRQVDGLSAQTSLGSLTAGHRAREMWEDADLEQRRLVVGMLIERVTIQSSGVSSMRVKDYWEGYKFDPSKVEIFWKV